MQTKIVIFDPATGEAIDSPKRVRNMLNYSAEIIIHEVNTLPSLTIPDQSMTVQTILDRHTRGLGLGNMTTPVYNLDDEGNELIQTDWQRLDISERVERLAQAKAYTDALRQKLSDDQSNKQKALQAPENGSQEPKPETSQPIKI